MLLFWLKFYILIKFYIKCGIKKSLELKCQFSDVRTKCPAFQKQWQHQNRSWTATVTFGERPQKEQQGGLDGDGHGLSPASGRERIRPLFYTATLLSHTNTHIALWRQLSIRYCVQTEPLRTLMKNIFQIFLWRHLSDNSVQTLYFTDEQTEAQKSPWLPRWYNKGGCKS